MLVSFDGAVKLTDFGIAKASNRASTAGMLKGKFAYMAPEQARGEPVDARTDVFALGVTLWELLTGARLFDGDERPGGAARGAGAGDHLALAVQRSRSTRPSAALVMRALHREAARRYQTAGELERALQQYVIGSTHSPDDTDVGLFVRSLFPDEASGDEDSEPVVPLRLVPEPTGYAHREPGRAHQGLRRPRVAADRPFRWPPGGRGRAYAPTSAKQRTASRPEPTAPGVQSAVTQSPPGQDTAGARRLPPGRGRAGRAGRWSAPRWCSASPGSPSSPDAPVRAGPSPAPSPSSRRCLRERPSSPPPVAPPAPPRTEVPAPPAPAAGPPGFLVISARPWGKVFVDDKFLGDVEGSRRFSVPAGLHEVRLTNGRKVRNLPPVEVKPGKSTPLSHSFLDD